MRQYAGEDKKHNSQHLHSFMNLFAKNYTVLLHFEDSMLKVFGCVVFFVKSLDIATRGMMAALRVTRHTCG